MNPVSATFPCCIKLLSFVTILIFVLVRFLANFVMFNISWTSFNNDLWLFVFVIKMRKLANFQWPALKVSKVIQKTFLVYFYSPRDCTLKILIIRKEEEMVVNKAFMGFALSFTRMILVQRKPCMVYINQTTN